eukprot:jgi/Chlat1/7211/Chrsp57S06856
MARAILPRAEENEEISPSSSSSSALSKGEAQQQQQQQQEKPKKRICCACPETKAARDECVAGRGEDACRDIIEAHKQCLRREGFKAHDLGFRHF